MTSQEKPRGGVLEEHKLPEAYVAKTSQDGNSVEISRASSSSSVKIAPSSFAAVANVLAKLWPDTSVPLEPGTTLQITDTFTGKSVAVAASALPDVANVLASVVGGFAGAPVVSVAANDSRKAEQEAPKRKPGRPRKEKATASSSSAASAPVKPSEPTVGPDPVFDAGVPDDMPAWFKNDHPGQLKDDDGAGGVIQLVRARLELEGGNNRAVKGRSKGKGEHHAWGYEVLHDGKHVAWVIAAAENQFILTGVEGIEYEPSSHKVMPGLIARLKAIVIPKLRALRQAA